MLGLLKASEYCSRIAYLLVILDADACSSTHPPVDLTTDLKAPETCYRLRAAWSALVAHGRVLAVVMLREQYQVIEYTGPHGTVMFFEPKVALLSTCGSCL
jgi:hypothetical protein